MPNPVNWIDPWGLTKNLPVTYWLPNDGAIGEKQIITLKSGTKIDRYGFEGGKYTSPYGTPYSIRALPKGSNTKPYNVYLVIKPIHNVEKSKIAPWFGERGMRTQYKMEHSVKTYLDSGHLKKINC